MNTSIEVYALALIAEECGETVQLCGKGLRFGLESPHTVNGQQIHKIPTCRFALEKEIGDILAAIDYAIERGLLNADRIHQYQWDKRRKLLSPDSRDNLGRRLAP